MTEGAAWLCKTLMSSNSIERMFSLVRHTERNIKGTRGSAVLQRWLGTVLLYREEQFKRVKGFPGIVQVMATIEAEHVGQHRFRQRRRVRQTPRAAWRISMDILTTCCFPRKGLA